MHHGPGWLTPITLASDSELPSSFADARFPLSGRKPMVSLWVWTPMPICLRLFNVWMVLPPRGLSARRAEAGRSRRQ